MARPVNVAELRPSEVLKGKNILLSGTTGFLGKVVLSMLLKRYPDVGTVFALIRPGVRQSAADRFEQKVKPSPALDPLREAHGDGFDAFIAEKVVPIDGDVTKANLGFTDEGWATLTASGVDVVINSAGLVDFDPPLQQALSINADGVKTLVEVCRELDAALLHVSTCFVAGNRSGQVSEDDVFLDRLPDPDKIDEVEFDHVKEIDRLGEIVEEVRRRADDPAQRAAWRSEAVQQLESEGRDKGDARALRAGMHRLKKTWLREELSRVGMDRAHFWGWTNTYTFTKSLGEQVIAKAVDDGRLNACIVRPAIVESAMEFPFAGWNEGFTTSAPLIMMCRRGLPHMPGAEGLILDIVPVDTVAGTIVAATAAILAGAHKLVYQACTGDINPLLVTQAIEFSGLNGRLYRRDLDSKGLVAWWLRHHETQPISKRTYSKRSIPKYRSTARKVIETVDRVGPERFGWMRQPANALHELATEVDRESERVDYGLELFMPFIADNRYVFRADNTRHLMSRIPEAERDGLHYHTDDFTWSQYWNDVHMPGLNRWVMPKLEEELEEAPKKLYQARSLIEIFETATHTHRSRVAFYYLDDGVIEHLTYGDLRTLGMRTAGYLVDKGIEQHDRVMLLCENRPEWVAAYFGIILAGGTVVPIDADSTPMQVENLAKSSGAKGLVISPKQRKRLYGDNGSAPARLVGAPLWSLQDVVCHREPLARPKDPSRIASVIFTSGTTGTPKGVMLSHRNFTFEVSRLGDVFKLNEKDHLVSVLPLHHTFEFTAGMLTPLSKGGCVTYLAEVDGDNLSKALKRGATGLVGVPALWQLLQRRISNQVDDKGILATLAVDSGRAVNSFLRDYFDVNLGPLAAYPVHRALGGRLRHLVSGGSALNAEAIDFFRSLGFNLAQGYGLTETAPVLTITPPREDNPAGSVGKPIHGVQLKIDEPNDEGVGEVLAKGPNVMMGYFENDAATEEVMLDDGWFRTGDLGRIDEEGILYLSGRQKDVIIAGDGRNVYPDELEEAFGEHDAIKEISVVGLPRDDGNETIACVIVPDYDSEAHADERAEMRDTIDEHLKRVGGGLPFHQRLKVVRYVDGDLPRTATRKVKRPEVITLLQRMMASEDKVEVVQTRAGSSDWVREVVVAISGHKDLKPDTALSSLNFDSLMVAELASALEAKAGVHISSESLIAAETLADVSTLVAAVPVDKPRRLATDIMGQGGDSNDDDEGDKPLPVPFPLAQFGKGVLGLGQRTFYDKVMDVDLVGKAYIPTHTHFLVASNHSSHLDAGLVKHALGDFGRNMASLAAKDYFFSGTVKRTYFETFTNLVPIERHGAVKESLRRALGVLEGGRSLLIFPEGTRSEDGRMQPFKPSLGYLAVAGDVPVLPMYLSGTYEAMPKGSTLLPRARKVGVTIGPAFTAEDIGRLAEGRSRSEAYRLVTMTVEHAVERLRRGMGYVARDLVDDVLASMARQPKTQTTKKVAGKSKGATSEDRPKTKKRKPKSKKTSSDVRQ